ncbi:MAG: LysM domain-containing protein [Anaerotignum propionicum]|nr:LysM domain-containing protein [Anaerotignum propionicum]MEA5057656.1 LysM domain-containing protein [Anaerotignum propionicum]
METHLNRSFAYTIRKGDTLMLIARHFHTTVPAIKLENPQLGNKLYIGQLIWIPQKCSYSEIPLQCRSIINEKLALNNRLRLLWEQHVYWTRMFITSLVFGLPDAEYVANRLLQNPKDFAVVLWEFYEEDDVSTFVELFTDHLNIAAELVKAAKAGDSAAAADAEKRWYANADMIAEFFENINPYWSAREWKKLLYNHLAMTKEVAVNMLNQKYENSIRDFNNIEQEALLMADTMTQGILKQRDF